MTKKYDFKRVDKKPMIDTNIQNDNDVDCPECQGTGIGYAGPDSACSRCGGSGIKKRGRDEADFFEDLGHDDLDDVCDDFYDGKRESHEKRVMM